MTEESVENKQTEGEVQMISLPMELVSSIYEYLKKRPYNEVASGVLGLEQAIRKYNP